VIGGIAGLLLGAGLLFVLRALAAPVLPIHADVSIDTGAVFVTAVLALCTGLSFGLVPAFAVRHLDAQATLRDETRGVSEGTRSHRLRGALVAGQMALCASLLAGAGLMARSLWDMTTQPLGFESDGVLTAAVRLRPSTYPTPEAWSRFLDQLAERLRAVPSVDAVATATSIPTAISRLGGVGGLRFTIEDSPASDVEHLALFASVSDDYFGMLQIPLRQGRTFGVQDHVGGPHAVVINQSMARRYWPGGNAVGARIRFSDGAKQIVGIVGDVRNGLTRSDAEPMVYMSSRQAPNPRVRILLRANADPLSLVSSVERELAALDRGLPLQEIITLRRLLDDGLAPRRLPVALMTAFGGLALLLASIGVYAMFASMAIAREREFGVRMALGSQPRAIARLMLRQGAPWMAVGLAGGAVGTMLLLQMLRRLLEDVPPLDPIAISVAVAIMVGCAIAALLLPVRRATRVDPAVTLRAS
jgi:predicted permease